MLVESYFHIFRTAIESCRVVQSSALAFDKRTSHEGFIRGEVYFADGSVLHVREFVDAEVSVSRLTYVYHYMSADGRLIFRYDNTRHHRDTHLPTFPHHKHAGSEATVLASQPMSIEPVLNEIEILMKLS